MGKLDFQFLGEKDLFDARIFQLTEARCVSPLGKEAGFYRLKTPDWANVIAQTPNEGGEPCFVMVRQYRHGSQTLVWEFPGGMVNQGEDPAAAALRELEEETGYQAHHVELLGSCNPNPAFMTNQSHTFFTDQVTGGFTQTWDEHEFVEVGLVPVTQVLRSMGQGEFANGVMVMAAYWYLLRQRLNREG